MEKRENSQMIHFWRQRFMRNLYKNYPDRPGMVWNRDNLIRYRLRMVPHHFGRKFFYLDPQAPMVQLEEVMCSYRWYLSSRGEQDYNSMVESILQFDPAVFRVDIMKEIDGCPGEFRFERMDLIRAILDNQDRDLLRRFYPYINLSDYADMADEINGLVDAPGREAVPPFA